MADVYKRLGAIAPTDSYETILYTAPAGKDTLVSNITVANRSATNQTFDINVHAIEPTITNGSSNLLVMVARNSSVFASSTDGITWAQGALPDYSAWSDLAYGNSTLVAISSSSNNVATSTDGITWTQRTISSYANWSEIAYGNGVFVAVVQFSSSKASVSTDGITWTESTMPSASNGFGVTYGNGVFVATAYGSSIAASSTDGITWTESTMPASTQWFASTYGNGVFVATAYGSSIAASSTDGITWTQRVMPRSAYWGAVAYGNGLFVAVANGTEAAKSTDGITWTTTTLASAGWYLAIAYLDGLFVVAPDYGDISSISTDGITWTQVTLPSSAPWRGATVSSTLSIYSSPMETNLYENATILSNQTEVLEPGIVIPSGGSLVVKNSANLTFSAFGVELDTPTNYKILGQSSGVGNVLNYTVPDGKQALIRAMNVTNSDNVASSYSLAMYDSLASGNVIVGISSSVWTSIGGTTWTQKAVSPNPSTSGWKDIVYGNGTILASGDNSYVITSTDAVTWTQRSLPTLAPAWYGLTYALGNFSLHYSNVMVSSTNGITWTIRTTLSNATIYNVAYGNEVLLGKSPNGTPTNQNFTAATSTDGITWTPRTMPARAPGKYWPHLIYGNGKFLIADSYSSAVSTDGITWTESAFPSHTQGVGTPAYGNGIFLRTRDYYMGSDYYVTSTDGITWTERTLPISATWGIRPIFDGDIFLVLSYSELALTSTNGVTWTQRTVPEYAYTNYTGAYGVASLEVALSPEDLLASSAYIGPNETHTIKGGFTAESGLKIALETSSDAITLSTFGLEIENGN